MSEKQGAKVTDKVSKREKIRTEKITLTPCRVNAKV